MKDGYSNRFVEDERRDEVMRLMEQVVKYIVYPWRRWLRYRYEQGNMRHSLVLMTTLVLMLVTGCGSGNGGATEATGTRATTMTPQGKALVMYYSWSGYTKEMAEAIQANTGADIIVLNQKNRTPMIMIRWCAWPKKSVAKVNVRQWQKQLPICKAMIQYI